MAIDSREKGHAVMNFGLNRGMLPIADGTGIDTVIQAAIMSNIMALSTLPLPVAGSAGSSGLGFSFSFWS